MKCEDVEGPHQAAPVVKKGIAGFFQVSVDRLQLFYNSIELKDEDTPDELEMEAMVWKKEEMDIHIVSDQHET